MRRAWLSMPLICLAASSTAAATFDGGTPGGFLEFASGARADSLGRAYGAIAEGGESLLWNPAGLGWAFRNDASFSHANLYEGAALEQLSYAHGFDAPVGLGVSVVSFGSGKLTRRDSADHETGSFFDNQRALLFGLAAQPVPGVSVGIAPKIINRSLDGTSSTGFDFDLGLQARRGPFFAGFTASNLTRAELSRDGGADRLPRSVHFSGAAALSTAVLLVFETVTQGGGTEARGGVEVGVGDTGVAFRGGWDGGGPTFGAGWRYRGCRFDYGAANSAVLGFSHRLSLGARWGKTPARDSASRTEKAMPKAEQPLPVETGPN